jgi:hypothetical protein
VDPVGPLRRLEADALCELIRLESDKWTSRIERLAKLWARAVQRYRKHPTVEQAWEFYAEQTGKPISERVFERIHSKAVKAGRIPAPPLKTRR